MSDKKLSIVIVDDDENLREINAYNFSRAKFEVFEGNDGLEGLELAKKYKPGLVFSGVMMPNMDGFGLLKALKEDPETRGIPVLIFSHLGNDEDRKKAIALGATDFIVKGLISPVEIVAMVKDILLKRTYRVVINPSQLDGKNFMLDYNLSSVTLELDPRGSVSGEFKTKLVKDMEDFGSIKLEFKD